jgi:outer membrane immunogenic protein
MRRLQFLLLVAFAVIGFATMTSAADLPLKTPVVQLPPGTYDWTGFYIGGNLGGGWLSNRATQTFDFVLAPVSGNTDGSGVLGGFQEGINWQFSRTWVVGIEADWSFTDAGRGFSRQGLTDLLGHTVPISSTNMSAKLDWLASARNRLGYLVRPDLMVYGTGGVAWGKIGDQGATSINDAGFVYSSNVASTTIPAGWVAGGGLEWMLGSNWLLRGEYLFYHLNSQAISSTNLLSTGVICIPGPCAPQVGTTTYSLSNINVNVLRAALSYKF